MMQWSEDSRMLAMVGVPSLQLMKEKSTGTVVQSIFFLSTELLLHQQFWGYLRQDCFFSMRALRPPLTTSLTFAASVQLAIDRSEILVKSEKATPSG
jgi:hypothetical protein